MTQVTRSSAPPSRLDDLLDALAALLQAGDPSAVEAFLADHPDHAGELRRMLPAMQVLAGLDASGDGAANALPEALGDFRIVREVGRGGMGVVYEAEQLSLRRRVALKVLPWAAAMDPKHLQRFKNEALAAASLKHDHIVSVYAVGCERGMHFYAMEFVEGQTLAQLIQGLRSNDDRPASPDNVTLDYAPGGAPAPTKPVAALSTQHSGPRGREFYRQAAELIAQAADALEHAHSLGVVHRDVKPGNLLLDASGKVYVSDFGLARFDADAGLTASGDLLGTLRYMSPEQALARHGLVDHRTDVYSLGATLYELLTLRPAVDGEDKHEILRRIAFEEPAAPRRIDKAIPAELETVTLKALAKNPSDRYATAGEFADDLRRWLWDQAIKAKPPSLVQRATKWSRRHVAVVWGAAAVAAVTLAALVVISAYAWHKNAQLTAAYSAESKARADAVKGQQLARRALDEMSSEVIDDWLSKQETLTKPQRTFLERALAYYQEFAAQAASDPTTRLAVAEAFQRVGDIQHKLGQLAEAEPNLRKSLALLESHDSEVRTNASRAAVLDGHSRLGHLYWQQGQNSEAERHYEQVAAACRALVAEFPKVPNYRRGLSNAQNALGVIYMTTRQFAKAEVMLRESASLQEQLVADYPAAHFVRVDLAGSYHNLGEVYEQLGRRGEAEVFYRKAVAEFDGWPSNASLSSAHRDRLAGSLQCLSVVITEPGRMTDAEHTLRRAITIDEKLVAEFPSIPRYRKRLASGHLVYGQFLLKTPRWAEAESHFRRAIELFKRVAVELPAVLELRDNLAIAQWRLANHLFEAGSKSEADAYYRQNLTELERLCAEAPGVARYHLHMAISYADAADPARWDGPRAILAAQRAIDLEPGDGWHWVQLGAARYRAGDWSGAAAALTKGLELRADDGNGGWFYLAMARWQLGDKDEARRCFAKGAAWMDENLHRPYQRRLEREVADLLGIKDDPPTPNAKPPDP